MRVAIHQALKDIHLLRWIQLAWVLLNLALHAFALYAAYALPHTDVRGAAGGLDALMPIAYLLLGCAVAGFFVVPILLVQTDPAVGTTAFWFTRPVGRWSVLTGKVLVIVAAVVLLPSVVDLVTALVAGVPLGGTLGPCLLSLAVQVAWLLPVMALAALTTTLAQFVLLAVVEVLVFFGSAGILRGLFDLRPRAGYGADILGMGCLLLMAIVVVVVAYRWRDQRKSAAVGLAAPICAVLVAMLVPWNPNDMQLPAVGGGPLPASVHIDPDSVHFIPGNQGSCSLSSTLAFSDLPGGLGLRSDSVRIRFRHDAVVEQTPASIDEGLAPPRLETAGAAEAFISGRSRSGDATITADLKAAMCNAVADRRGTLEVTLRFTGWRTVTSVLPVARGARFGFATGNGEVIDVRRSEEAAMVTVREIGVTDAPGPAMHPSYALRFHKAVKCTRGGRFGRNCRCDASVPPVLRSDLCLVGLSADLG